MKQLILCLTVFGFTFPSVEAAERPNILWFVIDDMSANFSCYGETQIKTPYVDQLAAEGVRFSQCHVTAPVCSTNRSAFITGMYQTSIGAQNHRTDDKIRLPAKMKLVPTILQEAGYYTCHGTGLTPPAKKIGKTDYNVVWDSSLYDGTDWSGRNDGQPFFMQVHLKGGKLRGANLKSFASVRKKAVAEFGDSVKPEDVTLPAHYPRDPVLLDDWAAYLDSVRLTDLHVGQVLERLDKEGLADNTLVIFMTDHGISHARGKQFLTYEGTHVPFVVRGPGIKAGEVRTDLIEHIDMAAISLGAAGIEIPSYMEARDVLAKNYHQRAAVFSARDRCDETVDFIRSVRANGYVYIRNYNPWRPHLQPSRYKDGKVIVQRLRELHAAGELTEDQERLLFSATRPAEELYNTREDPSELTNLADSQEHAKQLAHMRQLLDEHLIETRDCGFMPEPFQADVNRDESTTVYEFARQTANYPIGEIVPLANAAIRAADSDGQLLREAVESDNAVVRYWGAVGLRDRAAGDDSVEEAATSLLNDPDASVRITALSTLGQLGEPEKYARKLLFEAYKAETDAHALWALDAIKFLDVPHVIDGVDRKEVVKGNFSARAYEFLADHGTIAGGYPQGPEHKHTEVKRSTNHPLVFEEDFENGRDRWETTDDNVWQWKKTDGNGSLHITQRTNSYKPTVRSPHHIALIKDVEVADFELTFRVRGPNDTGNHRDCCVFFNHQDATHFYYVHLGAKPDPASGQIMIVNDAPRTPLTDNKKLTPWTEDWHQVKVVRNTRNGRINIFFDDMTTPHMSVVDKTFGKGRVGIGSFDDINEFDDVKLWGQ